MGVQAVATTGIYCRPECSARPLARNVADFSSPVAAEAAGYRSCLRCRPDRYVRTDPITEAPRAVIGAMALISGGYLDRYDEDALARQVGYSTRQLRRLFERHVGATPDFVARSRRAHFARRLLDETDLSMTAVARAAGFGSARQMNRVVRAIFGFAPGELRDKRRSRPVADGGLRLRLPLIEPFDRRATLDHLAARATPGVESVDGDLYRRTLEVCGNPGVIEVDLSGEGAELGLVAHLPTFDRIIDDVSRVRQMFGLDDHLEPAEAHLAEDPALAPLVQIRPGLRVVGGWDRFETAVRTIVGQQVSVTGAATVTGKLAVRHGQPLPGEVLGLTRVFPTAADLADLDPADAGMPRTRARTLSSLSAAVLSGDVDLFATDPDEARASLLAVPGLGSWTVEVMMMRAWRDPDAFPAADLGIRRAIQALDGLSETPAATESAARAERWRPHRALAAQHLWAALAARDLERQLT